MEMPQTAPQTLSQKIAGLERKDGLFPLDWDAKEGKLYLEIPETDKDFLLLDQLPYGLGSNDIGLDRGQLGQARRNRPRRLHDLRGEDPGRLGHGRQLEFRGGGEVRGHAGLAHPQRRSQAADRQGRQPVRAGQ